MADASCREKILKDGIVDTLVAMITSPDADVSSGRRVELPKFWPSFLAGVQKLVHNSLSCVVFGVSGPPSNVGTVGLFLILRFENTVRSTKYEAVTHRCTQHICAESHYPGDKNIEHCWLVCTKCLISCCTRDLHCANPYVYMLGIISPPLHLAPIPRADLSYIALAFLALSSDVKFAQTVVDGGAIEGLIALTRSPDKSSRLRCAVSVEVYPDIRGTTVGFVSCRHNNLILEHDESLNDKSE